MFKTYNLPKSIIGMAGSLGNQVQRNCEVKIFILKGNQTCCNCKYNKILY